MAPGGPGLLLFMYGVIQLPMPSGLFSDVAVGEELLEELVALEAVE